MYIWCIFLLVFKAEIGRNVELLCFLVEVGLEEESKVQWRPHEVGGKIVNGVTLRPLGMFQ